MKVKLYEPFMKWYMGGRIYLYSDLHFQHDTEMEQYFNWPIAEERLERINKVVTKNDTFVCLGDVGDRLDLVSKIKCNYKVLITGNHDAGNGNYQRKHKFQGKAKSIQEAKEAVRKGEWFNGREMVPVSYWSENNPRFATELYYDNRLFDEIYDGPLFIRDKLVLSHERVELPFALNIHGHEHLGVYATQKELLYKDRDVAHYTYLINIAADVVDFKPIALDDILKEYPLKNITDIHRLTIDYATAQKKNLNNKFYFHDTYDELLYYKEE